MALSHLPSMSSTVPSVLVALFNIACFSSKYFVPSDCGEVVALSDVDCGEVVEGSLVTVWWADVVLESLGTVWPDGEPFVPGEAVYFAGESGGSVVAQSSGFVVGLDVPTWQLGSGEGSLYFVRGSGGCVVPLVVVSGGCVVP